jgi:quinoprotein glucose dehydrogenase
VEICWQTPHGATPDRVQRHPALAGLEIPPTGEPCEELVGPLVTKALVVMGKWSYPAMPDGQRRAMLLAYNKATELVWTRSRCLRRSPDLR